MRRVLTLYPNTFVSEMKERQQMKGIEFLKNKFNTTSFDAAPKYFCFGNEKGMNK